jgi:putative hydrolase of the HAD superfamily
MYTHLFFDLDRTLWDFDTNSTETLTEIISDFQLHTHIGFTDNEHFIEVYKKINNELWSAYGNNIITKERVRNERFEMVLRSFNINDAKLALAISDAYIHRSPLKKVLMPSAIDVLQYLSGKYTLHIITNGFNDVQFVKLKHSQLESFFTHIITSEKAESKKPAPAIFDFALQVSGATLKNSIMIGDNMEADCIGARMFGMDQIFYNTDNIIHQEKFTHEVSSLLELKRIL